MKERETCPELTKDMAILKKKLQQHTYVQPYQYRLSKLVKPKRRKSEPKPAILTFSEFE